MSERLWECEYKHDRRAKRHRCRCCWKIIKEGERVVMARVANRSTWALHEECSTKLHHPPAHTWLAAFQEWSKI